MDTTKTKKRLISDTVASLSPSGIRKFFDLLASMEGVISLGVGEPDYVTPWRIRESAIYSLEQGYTSYTSNYGTPELRRALSDHLRCLYGVEYNPQGELLITVGVSEGLDLALRAIINPGDEVIMSDPCYVAYPACVTLAGGVPVFVPTRVESGFRIKASDIEAKITPRTKALLIGYPANPTGAVLSKGELEAISEMAVRRGVTVISDEVYARLVYGVEHVCFSSLPEGKDNCVLLGGFSKAYAMTGWRIGYAAAPKEILEAMTKVHQYTMLCAPTIGQMAALEALQSGETEVVAMVDDYNQRRRLMVKGLNDIGLECFEPRGAFYAFPSIRTTGLTSEEFAEGLLNEERVAAVPGSAFGKCGEGYIRCCYATAVPDIEEALRRMGRFVNRHRSGAKPGKS
ncbi:MAG: aminotransferase class I/II-fold pyridoxal phosphate-dependent enzyme [Dehalococcoidia bacterium]|nr:aminotransferase class I/II-fold pyridoxal phosphate-dependent enzyme [Dehalococcoidia bacterium]